MKINYRRRAKRLRLFTFLCFITAMIYATYLGPIFRFLNNYIPDDSVGGDPVLSPGADVIDLSDYLSQISPTPMITNTPSPSPTPNNYTIDPNSTPTATPAPTPTKVPDPTIPVIYVPDPKVPGVKQISGKMFTVEPDAVNILLLGVDEKYNNVDSIFIASISESKKTIKLVSVPRDAYVPYPQSVVTLLKSPRHYFTGIFKVNAAYYVGNNVINYQDGKFSNKGINFLCSVLDGLLVNADLRIDDYVRVNFEGFTELVDIAGGIYVNVPEDMYNSNGKLFLAKGRQFINSKTALEFVRRRHRYDSKGNMLSSTGDPYRKANQLAFLQGCAEQLITLDSVAKAPQILESLSKNVYHSINTLSKLSKYSSIATDYANGKYKMELLLIVGKSIDPLGDRASYVDIIT